MGQVEDVVRVVCRVVGAEDVVGAYQHGSATLGGVQPHSDVDVLVVVRRGTTGAERRALVEALSGVSEPGRPVEVTVVVLGEVNPWRYPPPCEFLYGEWLREEYAGGWVPDPEPSPDLAALLAMVVRADAPLLGPSPREVLARVPQRDLLRGIVAGVPGLCAEVETDTRNVVLTLARIWMTLVTGGIVRKDRAADWASARLPEECRAVLAHARAVYVGDEDVAAERWGELRPGIRRYVAVVTAEIEKLAKAANLLD